MITRFARSLAATLLLAAAAAPAQDFPAAGRPIRIVVPFTAGGSSDFVARTVATKLTDTMKHSVIVENRPGGNTLIGAEHVAKSAPDGHTLYLVGVVTHASLPALAKKTPIDMVRDFAFVSNAIESPLVVAINPKVPANTLAEFIAYARANPGKVAYGSAGVGNTLHLAGEQFAALTGTRLTHIPYKGASQAQVDLIGGAIQVMFDLVQTPLKQIQAGNLRALAVTSGERLPTLPNVPTTVEAGTPGFRFSARIGFAAPAGTPAPVLARLHREIAGALGQPDVRAQFAAQSMVAAPSESPDAFQKLMQAEVERIGALIRAAGIQPE
ncbi:MAG: tripartite tricarboxylate transporter substrate binding protein [Burkholderiales bacterium]|nr:tripartite tricarboxylate transporter substrate binding protein [Burkholderiales bacterium]